MGRVILQKVNAGFRVHIDIEHSKITIKILEGEKAGTSHPQRQPSNYERNQHDLDDKDVADIQAIIPLLGGCHFFTSRGSKYFPSTNMTPPPLSSSQENRDPLSGPAENHDIHLQ